MNRSTAPDTPADLAEDRARDAPPAHAQHSVDTTRKAPAKAGHAPDDPRVPDPKLPHENDESVGMTDGAPDANVEQAYRDVQRGLQDTDRGPAADQAYRKQKS